MVARSGYEAVIAEGGDAAATMLTGADAAEHRRRRARPRDARSRRPRRAGAHPRRRPDDAGDRADRARRHRQCRHRPCARAPSTSWSSRSAPSGWRCRCAMRSPPRRWRAKFNGSSAAHAGTLTFKDIVTRSPRMHAVLRQAEKAAGSAIPVLIEGRSGVGKELIARAIHGTRRAADQAVRRRQLRRDPRQSRRIDPVRAREGRLHRRDRPPYRQVRRGRTAARCSSTRSASFRRPRRSSSCARSRKARSSRSARASR